MEHVVQPGHGTQENAVVKEVLADEAGEQVEVRRAGGGKG